MIIDSIDQYTAILAEIDQLKAEVETIYSKNSNYVTDGVEGSSKTIPFAKHHILISGYEVTEDVQDEIGRLAQTYRDKIKTLCKARDGIEKALDEIQDAKLRVIVRYKYINEMSWQQIADKLGGKNTENSVKQYFKRNFSNVTHVTV